MTFAELLQDASSDEYAAPRDRATRRRRVAGIITASVLVALLALSGGYVAWALTAPVALPSAETGVPRVSVPEPVEFALPTEGVTAVRVSGGEQYLGPDGLKETSGDDDVRPIASITKLITALVVLDRKPLDGVDDQGPTLTFRGVQALYDKYYVQNATVARMRPGSTMSQREALETMLVISASNYAEAVSTWAYGSPGSFRRAANDWLARHGFGDTRLVEPTGIDPGNVSTPSDMLALAELAMTDPVIADIVGMEHLDVPGFSGSNTNTLLGVDGIRGIKTGTLNTSGANLLFSSLLDVGIDEPLEVTGVVLGGRSRDDVAAEVSTLLESIRAGFHDVPVGTGGRVVGFYETAWGASAQMVLASSASVFTWSDTPIAVEMTTTELTTGRAGEKVGTVTWTAGSSTATVDIVLDADIEKPDAWWRLTHPFELGG